MNKDVFDGFNVNVFLDEASDYLHRSNLVSILE